MPHTESGPRPYLPGECGMRRMAIIAAAVLTPLSLAAASP
jgi:hypothetical protein